MAIRFEWDKSKAQANRAKHGVSFELAEEVFKDPFAIELLDDRKDYEEERYIMLGAAGGRVLYVAFTERDEVIRIISARGATKYEEKAYREQSR
jgi:uncharacterized protein